MQPGATLIRPTRPAIGSDPAPPEVSPRPWLPPTADAWGLAAWALVTLVLGRHMPPLALDDGEDEPAAPTADDTAPTRAETAPSRDPDGNLLAELAESVTRTLGPEGLEEGEGLAVIWAAEDPRVPDDRTLDLLSDLALRLVRENWCAVEVLARALEAERELDGSTVEHLLRTHLPPVRPERVLGLEIRLALLEHDFAELSGALSHWRAARSYREATR